MSFNESILPYEIMDLIKPVLISLKNVSYSRRVSHIHISLSLWNIYSKDPNFKEEESTFHIPMRTLLFQKVEKKNA